MTSFANAVGGIPQAIAILAVLAGIAGVGFWRWSADHPTAARRVLVLAIITFLVMIVVAFCIQQKDYIKSIQDLNISAVVPMGAAGFLSLKSKVDTPRPPQ